MEEIVIGQICQILCKDYFSEHQGNKICDTILIQMQFDRKKKKNHKKCTVMYLKVF